MPELQKFIAVIESCNTVASEAQTKSGTWAMATQPCKGPSTINHQGIVVQLMMMSTDDVH